MCLCVYVCTHTHKQEKSAKLSFISKRETEAFLDKQKLKEIVIERSLLQENLKRGPSERRKTIFSEYWTHIKKGTGFKNETNESKIYFLILN
jgi:hypothetical protein